MLMPSLDHAATTLAAIAQIDSLAGGQVVYDRRTLAGGQWYPADDYGFELDQIVVPVPTPIHDPEHQVELCRLAIVQAIERRDLERAQIAHELGRDAGPS